MRDPGQAEWRRGAPHGSSCVVREAVRVPAPVREMRAAVHVPTPVREELRVPAPVYRAVSLCIDMLKRGSPLLVR